MTLVAPRELRAFRWTSRLGEADDVTKDEADYVDNAAGTELCQGCSMFEAPNACTYVLGTISPVGHCRFWEAAATTASAFAFNEDEPRDEHGKWEGSGDSKGSGGKTNAAAPQSNENQPGLPKVSQEQIAKAGGHERLAQAKALKASGQRAPGPSKTLSDPQLHDWIRNEVKAAPNLTKSQGLMIAHRVDKISISGARFGPAWDKVKGNAPAPAAPKPEAAKPTATSGEYADKPTRGLEKAAGPTKADKFLTAGLVSGGKPSQWELQKVGPEAKAEVARTLAGRMGSGHTLGLAQIVQGQKDLPATALTAKGWWARPTTKAGSWSHTGEWRYVGTSKPSTGPKPGASSGSTKTDETRRGDDYKLQKDLREQGVAKLVSQWAITSNDHNGLSLAIQEAAKEEFKLSGTAPWTAMAMKEAESIYQRDGSTLRAFVRAQYDTTQKKLAAAGLTSVRLYRGQNSLPKGTRVDQGGTSVLKDPEMRPMSSFSSRLGTAKGFAGWGKLTLAAAVPAERIIATPRSGVGCLNEREFVVLHGSGDFEIKTPGKKGGSTGFALLEPEHAFGKVKGASKVRTPSKVVGASAKAKVRSTKVTGAKKVATPKQTGENKRLAPVKPYTDLPFTADALAFWHAFAFNEEEARDEHGKWIGGGGGEKGGGKTSSVKAQGAQKVTGAKKVATTEASKALLKDAKAKAGGQTSHDKTEKKVATKAPTEQKPAGGKTSGLREPVKTGKTLYGSEAIKMLRGADMDKLATKTPSQLKAEVAQKVGARMGPEHTAGLARIGAVYDRGGLGKGEILPDQEHLLDREGVWARSSSRISTISDTKLGSWRYLGPASELPPESHGYQGTQGPMQSATEYARGDDTQLQGDLREQGVSKLVGLWAATSNDSNSDALAMQEVAASEFNLKDSMGWQTSDAMNDKVVDSMMRNGDTMAGFLHAQYAETQDMLRSAGIKSVELFRGFKDPTDEGLARPAWWTAQLAKGPGTEIAGGSFYADMSLRPMSSFTADVDTAAEFGSGENEFGEEINGRVIASSVPVERIIGTPLSGVGCRDEFEFVVLDGPGAYTVHGPEDAMHDYGDH